MKIQAPTGTRKQAEPGCARAHLQACVGVPTTYTEDNEETGPRQPRSLLALDRYEAGHHSTDTYCVSMNSINPSCAPSRPRPDCLTPPNEMLKSARKPFCGRATKSGA